MWFVFFCTLMFCSLWKKGKYFKHVIYCLYLLYSVYLFHMSGADLVDHKLQAVLDVLKISLWLLSRTWWWRLQRKRVFFGLKAQPLTHVSCPVKYLHCVEMLKSKVQEATVQFAAEIFFPRTLSMVVTVPKVMLS